jgi:hypothetical protein
VTHGMSFKYFRQKYWRKNWRFLLKVLLLYAKKYNKIGFQEKTTIFS